MIINFTTSNNEHEREEPTPVILREPSPPTPTNGWDVLMMGLSLASLAGIIFMTLKFIDDVDKKERS